MSWRRLLVLDVTLAIGLVAGILQVRRIWFEFEAGHRVESVKPEAEPARTLPSTAVPAAMPEDWTEISVKNPFSFDRNDVAIVAPKQTAPAAPVEPKPVLFGTLSLGKEWVAMLAPGPSGNRGSRPMRIGESISGWELVEIHEKSVVVTANGLRETVPMNDLPRVYDRTASAPIAPPPAVPNTPAPVASAPAQPPAAAPIAAPTSQQPKQRLVHTPFGDVMMTDPQ